MPTPQRVQHNTPAMRKNPSLSRNGGSDAEIMELNQQVEPYFLVLPVDSNWLDFYPQRRIEKGIVFLLFKLMELKLTVDGLEKERDFYFGKLRDIELICQEPESENHPILSKIMDILYATEVAFHAPPIHQHQIYRAQSLLKPYLHHLPGCPVLPDLQEGFAPPEDDDLEEQAHLGQDEY